MFFSLQAWATIFALAISVSHAVTVYKQVPFGAATPTAAAYNDTILRPPPIPQPAPTSRFQIQLQRKAAEVPNLSMPHVGGSFYGFSIEMSVTNQILGKNSSFIQVPFLNLMSNLQERAENVFIRLGGNTQEYAELVDHLDDGRATAKELLDTDKTTQTPAVVYTTDFFYIASNISSLVNVKWFLGIPFVDTSNWRLDIVQCGQAILGENLVGLQAGNEPDLYSRHGLRPPTYSPMDHFNEFKSLIQTINDNPQIPVKNILIGPSIATGDWFPEDVWNTGFITAFRDNLYAITVEHYPNNNCFAQFGIGSYQDPQDIFPTYLNHTAVVSLVAPYLNSTFLAQQAGRPFIMFETNTASCGGFPGISDSYGAALWALDYGLQMAFSNFSHALLHIGGQSVFYNPFTAPPTNQSSYHEWTVGAIYYSTLVIAEALGKSNTSQTIDLYSNGNNMYTPSYAIYEQGVLSKVALFNYLDDPTGGSDLAVSISIPGDGVPSSIKVKYLESDSVSSKSNITWAGQTLGNRFQVDGRLKGDLNVVTISCDQSNNLCQVPVPAPGFALVFMENDPSIDVGEAATTFATTAHTKTINTVSIDPSVLATSNGHSRKDWGQIGSTSKGSISGASVSRGVVSGAMILFSVILGALLTAPGVPR